MAISKSAKIQAEIEKVTACLLYTSTHGTANLPRKTSSARSITDAVLGVYDAKVNSKLSIRRLTITANRLVGEDTAQQEPEAPVQFNLFEDVYKRQLSRWLLYFPDLTPKQYVAKGGK